MSANGYTDHQKVTIVLLGAPGVGKSSIVKQFVNQTFAEEYEPSDEKSTFFPSVIINEHVYDMKIVDCPYIPYFPSNSLQEWTDYRGFSLRQATAYVLVYDITSEDSFSYMKALREQILDSRDMHDVPLIIVGNKYDLSEDRGVSRRDVVNMVKKHRKCIHVECSAKYNWHIIFLFKELMKAIDYIDYGHKPTAVRVQDALRRNRCSIM